MIDKGNDRVNMVVYDGYVINKMYGCDGELVYNRSDEKYGCDTVYLEDYSGGTYTQSCMRENCDCLIGSVKNLIYRHDGIEETITYLNYAQKRSITSITIGDCVTSLENSVFANWSGVTEVTLSPYLVAIYGGGTYGAFYNCKSLRSITFPQHLRSVYDAFENCSSLSSVTFNDELKYLGANSFYGCSSLTDVEMPNSVVEVGIAAFNGCTSLSSVTLSSGLTEIEEHTFEGCSSLTDIVIPNNITIIRSSSFSQCTSLSSLTLSEGLLEIEEGCINGCFNLKSLTFPSTFSAFTYGQAMFSNTGVESVTFLNPTPPIVSHGSGSIGDVFVDASQLTNIYVPCDALMTYKNAWASEGTWLTNKLHPIQGTCPYPTYDFMQKTEWVYKSAEYSFERKASTCPIRTANAISGNESRLAPKCIYASNFPTDAHTVIIGDEVNSIYNRTFFGWTGLRHLYISSNVNLIYSNAFSNCSNLESITIWAYTPPELYSGVFDDTNNCPIYVLPSVVDAYKANSSWSSYRDRIQPIVL